MAKVAKRARIQLIKHVRIEGKVVEKGTKLEMDRYKATELIGAGQAKSLDDDEDEDEREPEDEEQYGVRIESPTNHDPGVKTLENAGNRGPGPKKNQGGRKPAEEKKD